MTWIEANEAFLEHLPQKTVEVLRIELELLEFNGKSALRLTTRVEKTLERCMDFYKTMHTTYNKCETSAAKKI